MTDIQSLLLSYSEEFNQKIGAFFVLPQGAEKRVMQAMAYSVLNGGKRLRPFLIHETAKLYGQSFQNTFPAAAALEMLHTYSLIHDDLPAMDNDDLRRGKPTCHKQFDEPTAILAGDGLLTLAFEVLAKANYAESVKIELIKLLAQGAGAFDGMVAGQMLDLAAEKGQGSAQPAELIRHIEEMKTGRLLRYAVQAGAIIGGASEKEREMLDVYAKNIGIAFQVADDILDVEGSVAEMGKTLHKDETQNKLTFVSCYGLKEAKNMAQNLVHTAQNALKDFGPKADVLSALADFVIHRRS